MEVSRTEFLQTREVVERVSRGECYEYSLEVCLNVWRKRVGDNWTQKCVITIRLDRVDRPA